ncbi:unnamed protein product [Menidia menidia]|uniref:(Atlantic silverside) hypothetical protein n=1 Tax=Menidia menidia TaxID=238744 RepID=A0A8S4BXK7_9TELE|nr:unnamed protein product [Menidia menidia]
MSFKNPPSLQGLGGDSQLAVGTCEIVMLNRDSSVPRRTIARQTARCACRRGQIAGTTRARPACVDGRSSDLFNPAGGQMFQITAGESQRNSPSH